MEFVRSLESELLKIKGSIIIWVSIFGGLLLSTVFTLRFIYLQYHINLRDPVGAWEKLFSQNARPFIGFLIPIGVILICTLITQIEYKNNNWKQVHTTPQRYSTIFFAKFTTLFLLTIFVFLLLNIGILLHGILPCLIVEGSFPKHPIPFGFFVLETLKCFVLTLPIIGFQYLLSLHYKNFMIAFGVGLTVYVGSMPGIKMGSIGYLSPYSFVLNYFDQVVETQHYWMALIYFILLTIFSYVLYLNKGEKG
ncbi:MAG: ABC transporter permease [Saprospiraceae bacterium]